MEDILQSNNRNGTAATALAFVTYSLVPYLGVLFCPGAIAMGLAGWVSSYRMPHSGGRSASIRALLAGLIILAVQIFLWWLLYQIPQWAGANPSPRATGPPF